MSSNRLPPSFSAPLNRAGAAWSCDEDRQVHSETKQGLSLNAIAHIHGRTQGAIRARQVKLALRSAETGKLIDPLPDFQPVNGASSRKLPASFPEAVSEKKSGLRHWRPEEDRLLYDETVRGDAPDMIARHHDRSEREIRKRQVRLQLRKRSSDPLYNPLPEFIPRKQLRDWRAKALTPAMISPTLSNEYIDGPITATSPTNSDIFEIYSANDQPIVLLWAALRSDIEILSKAPTLGARGKIILHSRLAPGDALHPFRTLDDLGSEFGVSSERIRQIEKKGRRALNAPRRLSASTVSKVLFRLLEIHCGSDQYEQAQWLLQQMLAIRLQTIFKEHILESFVTLIYPAAQRKTALKALTTALKQLRYEARKTTRVEAGQDRKEEAKHAADLFVLNILGKAMYGGNQLADFSNLDDFMPLRKCNGNRTEFSTTLNRWIDVESEGEAKLVKALDTCSLIDAFAEQAVQIPYEWDGKQQTYTPDLVVKTTEGLVYVIEVKARRQLVDHWVQHKAHAAQQYLGARGIGYCLVDARGFSTEDLRNVVVGADLEAFLQGRMTLSGKVHLKELRNHLGGTIKQDILDQVQSFALRENLEYRTFLYEWGHEQRKYGFDFLLKRPNA